MGFFRVEVAHDAAFLAEPRKKLGPDVSSLPRNLVE